MFNGVPTGFTYGYLMIAFILIQAVVIYVVRYIYLRKGNKYGETKNDWVGKEWRPVIACNCSENDKLKLKKKVFTLGHVALYAKGWYKRSEDFWKDMSILFEADGYLQNLQKFDIYRNLITKLDKMGIREMEPFQLLDGINPAESWRFGYVTKGNYSFGFIKGDKDSAPEYDFIEAVTRYCLHVIAFLKTDKICSLSPNFKDVLPQRLNENETKKEALKRAKESFKNVIH